MATQWLKTLSHKAAHVKMLQPVYSASLGRLDAPLIFQSYPLEILTADAGCGRWVANGKLDIHGYRVDIDGDNWFLNTPYEHSPFFEKLNGFEFLAELKALGGDVGRQTARKITSAWMENFKNYHHIMWSPNVTAQRIVNWLMAYPFAFETASDEFLEQFHMCFYRQYNHLMHLASMDKTLDDIEKYTTLWGVLIVQSYCADLYDEDDFSENLANLHECLENIILPDGGLIHRNPENLLEMSKSLLLLKQAVKNSMQSVPVWLDKKIEIIIKTMNNCVHSDKDIPTFQGAVIGQKNDIERLVKLSNLRFRKQDIQLPESGYTFIRKGKTSIAIDHGANGDHRSPLAFELSYNLNRLVVSCGTYYKDLNWQESLAHIAGHSALSVNEKLPAESINPLKVSLDGLNGASLFCGVHQGYVGEFGVTHTRRLYLDEDGEDVRGEDLLVRNTALKPLQICARFHLHPLVKALLTDDGMGVLMRLPSGAGWMFHAQGGEINLEESVYCEDGFNIRKTTQIIVSVQMDDLNHQLKWAFKRK